MNINKMVSKSLLRKETSEFLDRTPLTKKILFNELGDEKFTFDNVQKIFEKNGLSLDVYAKISFIDYKHLVFNYSIIDNRRLVAIEESKDYDTREEAEYEGFYKSLLVLERYLR